MKKLTATKVSQQLDISVVTLTNWYKWYNNPEFKKPEGTPELPMYKQAGERAPRYWKPEDIPKIKKFQEWLPKGRGGVMGELNSFYWGDRGVRAQKNRNTKPVKKVLKKTK